MMDEDGAIIAAEVHGWNAPHERWWADTRLALSSPLPHACRYESEPFWVNAEGFRTHRKNRYLEAMDLANCEKRAMCRATIVIPIHLPVGQIGAASFTLSDPEHTDLLREYEDHADELGGEASCHAA